MAKKARLRPGWAGLVLFALSVAACGGAAPAAKAPEGSPASPASDSEPSVPVTQSTGAQPASPEAAPPSAGGSNFDSNASSREAELRGARRDVQLATRDLDSSMGDCANVCRALSSLERATAHLCALAAGDSDRSACDDAKNRVTHARAQIKASCGTCPNGASLDAR